MGGSSYAAVKITGGNIRNGTVTGADVKNGSLKGRDIGNGSLTGSDLKNGSVTTSDIDDASLLAADFKAGELPAGPAGPAGPQGPQGTPGPAGATKVVARRVNRTLPPPSGGIASVQTGVASCQSGEVAVGGGAGTTNFLTAEGFVLVSEPLAANGSPPGDGEVPTQWRAAAFNNSGVAQTLRVHVLCASP